MTDPTAPTVDGFVAGTYVDGSTIYVGRGNNTLCNGQSDCPGQIKASNPDAGIYMTCGTGRLTYLTESSYLKNHPKLTWVPSNYYDMKTLPGVLHIESVKFPFWFGRVRLTRDGITFDQVSKVHSNGIYYYTPDGEKYNYTGYEVLVCAP